MEEKIIKFLSLGCRVDAIEIAYSLGVLVEKTCSTLQKLEDEGKIRKITLTPTISYYVLV